LGNSVVHCCARSGKREQRARFQNHNRSITCASAADLRTRGSWVRILPGAPSLYPKACWFQRAFVFLLAGKVGVLLQLQLRAASEFSLRALRAMYVPERRFHPAVTDLPITGYPLLPHPIRLNRIAVSGRYRLRKPSRRSRDPYAICKYSRRSIASLHDNAFR